MSWLCWHNRAEALKGMLTDRPPRGCKTAALCQFLRQIQAAWGTALAASPGVVPTPQDMMPSDHSRTLHDFPQLHCAART